MLKLALMTYNKFFRRILLKVHRQVVSARVAITGSISDSKPGMTLVIKLENYLGVNTFLNWK